MLRVPGTLLCLLGLSLCSVEARWTMRPRRTTTTTTATSSTTVMPEAADSSRLIDGFDQRSPDGQHEYRYQLSDGDTRYERSYWLPVGKGFVLARRGYYSVPLPNALYSTVFYRADHRGYHVDTHTLSGEQPLLPRTLAVPTDAKRNSISMPERNDELLEQLEQQPDAQASATGLSSNSSSSSSRTGAKVQATQQQNQTKPSTVATSDDIFAARVGTAPADDDDDDDDDNDDDDDDVAASNIYVN